MYSSLVPLSTFFAFNQLKEKGFTDFLVGNTWSYSSSVTCELIFRGVADLDHPSQVAACKSCDQ